MLIIIGIAGAGMYVMKLRSDNAILKTNQIKHTIRISKIRKHVFTYIYIYTYTENKYQIINSNRRYRHYYY